MMVGGAVGGIIGIYLSVPLVATLRVVWRRFTPRAGRISAVISPPVGVGPVEEEMEPGTA